MPRLTDFLGLSIYGRIRDLGHYVMGFLVDENIHTGTIIPDIMTPISTRNYYFPVIREWRAPVGD